MGLTLAASPLLGWHVPVVGQVQAATRIITSQLIDIRKPDQTLSGPTTLLSQSPPPGRSACTVRSQEALTKEAVECKL